MGSQIGLEYALGGHDVVLVSRHVEAARERVEDAIATLARLRVVPRSEMDAARARMTFRSTVQSDDAVELVLESLPEVRETKAELVRAAAEQWPAAMIATNSSSIGVSELGCLAGVEKRIVATHYWNPPLLMPLVEMLAGAHTPESMLVSLAATLRGLGKRPVLLKAEVPGMLWNRVQAAVLRECLWLVEHGVASPQKIDEVMRDGLARRWHLLGPFETVALGGTAVFDAIAENLFPVLSNALEGHFGDCVTQDPAVLDDLAARRDQALAAELLAERTVQ
jgi:3-hydroxybutyryl-CoA dehydrogenase